MNWKSDEQFYRDVVNAPINWLQVCKDAGLANLHAGDIAAAVMHQVRAAKPAEARVSVVELNGKTVAAPCAIEGACQYAQADRARKKATTRAEKAEAVALVLRNRLSWLIKARGK